MAEDFDLLIVGGGLAGLTAGMYAARIGLRTMIVEHMAPGGQVLNVEKIENFPGFPQGVAGFDLGPMVQAQAEAAGAEFVMETATGLSLRDDRRVLHCARAPMVQAQAEAAGAEVVMDTATGLTLRDDRRGLHCAGADLPCRALIV